MEPKGERPSVHSLRSHTHTIIHSNEPSAAVLFALHYSVATKCDRHIRDRRSPLHSTLMSPETIRAPTFLEVTRSGDEPSLYSSCITESERAIPLDAKLEE